MVAKILQSDELHATPNHLASLMTPLDKAVVELAERRKNIDLVRKVEEFLNGDLPDHFKNGPILYLSRHVATPNFETLRFIELAKHHNIPAIIGQDTKDIFVSHNPLKRALGKMPIVKGVSKNNDEIIEFITIVDFDTNQGEQFKNIRTHFNEELPSFHTNLLKTIYPDITVLDESDWVDRNGRGDLIEHYVKLLSLLIVHGVMLEFYPANDLNEQKFLDTVLIPAFTRVEKMFNHKPLISFLIEPHEEDTKNWVTYPSIVYKIVREKIDQIHN